MSIGIDLGTTYCCVATVEDGEVKIIANGQGNRITPSYVAFTENGRLVGEEAKMQMLQNTANTLYDIKRLIGRMFKDAAVQDNMRWWDFKVVDCEHLPKIKVRYLGEIRYFNPEEISAMILSRMKMAAENYIGKEVSVVITVPAYFNDSQRWATMAAAKIARLNVLKIINEPTAAALAYRLQIGKNVGKNVLIFDLGGGTFDVTILRENNDSFEVVATTGDCHLGGQDFNNRLYGHFLSVFARIHNTDLRTSEKSKCRLREECERTKILLSAKDRVNVQIGALYDGLDFDTFITRRRFEQLNDDLFRSTLELVERAISDARMEKQEIDNVVLVGGSTRIPHIQEMLQSYFGEEKICKMTNPDEAVAYGAAAHAAFLSGHSYSDMNLKLQDVTPLSLGICTHGDIMTIVIKRNTPIPVRKWHSFTTVRDDQEKVNFSVFQGERASASFNRFLGSFSLSGIPPRATGKANIRVCFAIDEDGVLDVSAVEENSEKQNTITITQDSQRMSRDEIQRMITDWERYFEEDIEWKKRMEESPDIEVSLYGTKERIVEDEQVPKRVNKQDDLQLSPFLRQWNSETENDDEEFGEDFSFGFEPIIEDGAIENTGGKLCIKEYSVEFPENSVELSTEMTLSLEMDFRKVSIPPNVVPISAMVGVNHEDELNKEALIVIPTWFIPQNPLEKIQIFRSITQKSIADPVVFQYELDADWSAGKITFQSKHFCKRLACTSMDNYERGTLTLAHALLHKGCFFKSVVCYLQPEELLKQKVQELKNKGFAEIEEGEFELQAKSCDIKLKSLEKDLYKFLPLKQSFPKCCLISTKNKVHSLKNAISKSFVLKLTNKQSTTVLLEYKVNGEDPHPCATDVIPVEHKDTPSTSIVVQQQREGSQTSNDHSFQGATIGTAATNFSSVEMKKHHMKEKFTTKIPPNKEEEDEAMEDN